MACRVLAKWPQPGACPHLLTCRAWSPKTKETIPTWLLCLKTVQDGRTSRNNPIKRGKWRKVNTLQTTLIQSLHQRSDKSRVLQAIICINLWYFCTAAILTSLSCLWFLMVYVCRLSSIETKKVNYTGCNRDVYSKRAASTLNKCFLPFQKHQEKSNKALSLVKLWNCYFMI